VVEWRDEKLYSVREAAGLLKLDRGHVHNLVKAGKLGGRLLPNGRYKVSEADIDAFLAGVPAVAPKGRTDAQRRRAREAAGRELDRLLGSKP
jgi:excisionase family DNA binding protein